MRKGALPIPYIIALIIGVIVVAVLAYWFISSSGKGTGIGTEAECRGRVLEWCITKSSADQTKANEVCSSIKGFGTTTDWDKFCCKVIANYKPSSDKCE